MTDFEDDYCSAELPLLFLSALPLEQQNGIILKF